MWSPVPAARGFTAPLFEFVRNEVLNANDFLSNSVTNPAFGRDDNGKAKRTPFRYNNFGGTISGPVYLPRFGEGGASLYRLKRTFFFFSEEQRRDIRYPLLSSTVPDLNMRQGIFPIDICLRANAPTANDWNMFGYLAGRNSALVPSEYQPGGTAIC